MTYYGTAYPGANQTVTNYCLEITGDGIVTPIISADGGNLLTLGSDGLPFFAELIPFKNVTPEVSNGAGANTGNIETTFTPTETRDYVFEYSGDVQQGGGGMSVGTTVLGTDLFVAAPASGDADGSRLTLTRQENFTPPIPLTAGVTYHITQWAGGGGIIFNHTVCVQEQLPDALEVVGTNPAARLEITNNTLQSELSLVLGDLGISVDGVAIMPMTSADYTQGGITAVTADSTNWTRASTGNGPTDTNVGFENVPQGRYRYSFSIPEQEDGSTVDANDVADNDRPFPIILVNGVPAKLHADNTYIEHDDGSTSEYHSSGTIVVPEGGSVQLGLVIEGGDTEEFEFQSAVITTEQGVDAIYGFFEIEKIDRPVVQSATDQPTRTVVNGITIREHADGYIEMSGTDSTGALTLRIITFPNGITMENANYEAHCNIENASANRFAQISSRTTTTLVLRPHNTASNIIWSVKGYRA